MMKILKRNRRVNGELVVSKNYYLRYRTDSMPCDKFISLRTSDKSVAEILGRKKYEYFQQVEAGIAQPQVILDSKKLPLSRHIENFCAELMAKGRSEDYIYTSGKQLAKYFRETSSRTLADISAESFEQWRRLNSVKAPKTLNDYRAILLEFMKWHLKHKRVASNPIEAVEKVKKKKVVGRERRSLNEKEIRDLIAVDRYRGLVYYTAVSTGLRRKEMSLLEWRDIDFKGLVIRARASTTKNSKRASQPISNDLSETLRLFKGGKKESEKVFSEIPTVPELKEDLKSCGIPFLDEHMKRFDFHALRGTFCTMLASSGVGFRTAQALMRHSDPRLTSEIYTDEDMLPKRDAIDKLPSFTKLGAHIGAQISDNSSQKESQSVAVTSLNEVNNNNHKPLFLSGYDSLSRGLSQLDVMRADGRPTRART